MLTGIRYTARYGQEAVDEDGAGGELFESHSFNR